MSCTKQLFIKFFFQLKAFVAAGFSKGKGQQPTRLLMGMDHR